MAAVALFADILDYPEAAVASQVRSCVSELAGGNPEAAELMVQFQMEQARMTLGRLQELYTSTFEFCPECTLNLGYHLFGNDARRNMFMAQLKQRMEKRHVEMGRELPDHLCLILRLLERQDSEEERSTLIEDCLIPAISRMLGILKQDSQPNAYGLALRALLILLQKQCQAEPVSRKTLAADSGIPLR